MKGKVVSILLSLILVSSLIIVGCGPPPPHPVVRLNAGTVATTSSTYAMCVAEATAVHDYAPWIEITLMETGSGEVNMKLLESGDIDVSMTGSNSAAGTAYQGLPPFEKPMLDSRYLVATHPSLWYVIVREDSGVTKLEDLEGKKFNPGMAGSQTVSVFTGAMEALGIKPDYFQGSLTDVVAAIKDGRCIGYFKFQSGAHYDATTIDLASSLKLKVLSFTPEQRKIVDSKVPFITWQKVTMADAPEVVSQHGEILTFGTMGMASVLKDFPEEVAYTWVKALKEGGQAKMAEVFQASEGIKDTIQDTIDNALVAGVPLHAGTVRACREYGVKVPDELIPPEMK